MRTAIAKLVQHQRYQRAPVLWPNSRAVPSIPLAPTAALTRRGSDNGVIIRRLEQAKPCATKDHRPDNIQIGGEAGNMTSANNPAAIITIPSAPSKPA